MQNLQHILWPHILLKMDSFNGYIYMLKPANMTSFDLVNYVRRRLSTKKVGHTGTLDPNAMGVMVLCLGRGTKAIPYFEYDSKSYRAEMLLGVVTDTYDTDGQVLEAKPCDATDDEIIAAVESFCGDIDQVPPMYSAIKIDGQKMYDVARRGETVDLPARKVKIHSISVNSITRDGDHVRVLFDVDVSKGTYIRSLCYDIGKKLGCPACMSYLYRTSCGAVMGNMCVSLTQFEKALEYGTVDQMILPTDHIFHVYPEVHLSGKNLAKASNGVAIKVDLPDGLYRVYSDTFMGPGRVIDNMLKLEKRFDT